MAQAGTDYYEDTFGSVEPKGTNIAADVGGGLDISKVSADLAGLQKQKIAVDDRTLGDLDRTTTEDQARARRAYDASVASIDSIPPKWDAEAEHEKFYHNPVEAFGSLGSVFGILASAFTHAPMENALNASAAAMNSLRANDEAGYERAHKAWKENTDLAIKRHNMMRDAYSDALELSKTNMAAGMQRLKTNAIRFEDRQTLLMIEAGLSKELIDSLNARNRAAEGIIKLREANMKLTNAEQEQQLRTSMLDKDPEWNNDEQDPYMKAAKKLRAFQRSMGTEKQGTPAQAILGQYIFENPNATAQEIADFANENGLLPYHKPLSAAQKALEARIQEIRDKEGREPTSDEIVQLEQELKAKPLTDAQKATRAFEQETQEREGRPPTAEERVKFQQSLNMKPKQLTPQQQTFQTKMDEIRQREGREPTGAEMDAALKSTNAKPLTPQQFAVEQFRKEKIASEGREPTAAELAEYNQQWNLRKTPDRLPSQSQLDAAERKRLQDQYMKPTSEGGLGLDQSAAFAKAAKEVKLASQADLINDEGIRLRAERVLAGDQAAYTNLGRGAQGAENIKKLDEAVVKLAKERGMSGADITQAMVENQGRRAAARALGTREVMMAMAIGEALPMADLVQEASDKYKRTNLPKVNEAINAWRTNTGDPNIRAYGAAVNSFLNAYVRAVSPVGAPTDLVRKHSYDLLSTADSPAAVKAVIEQLKKEMHAAEKSPDYVRELLRKGAVGKQIADLADKPAVAPRERRTYGGKTYELKTGADRSKQDSWEVVEP